MRVFALIVGVLCLSLRAFAAGIEVRIESNMLYHDVIQGLEIRAWGLEEELDYSPLLQQFEVVDKTFGSVYRVLDGKAQQVYMWQLNVRPKAIGEFMMPIIEQEGVQSRSFRYQVKAKPSGVWRPEADAVSAYWRISERTPYVQQGTLVTLVIEHQYPVSHLKINWPTFAGLRVIDRGEERYLRTKNKRRIEKSWYIIGESSGLFEQAELDYEVQLNRSRIEHAIVTQKTPPLSLEIRPIPDNYLSSWALVAKDVHLEESWSQPVNQLLVGQQRKRTFTVRAKGVLADQIPDVVMPLSRGVDVEAIVPFKRSTRWINNEPMATATFTYLITAKSPIPVFFDNVRLSWFSIPENQPKQSLIYALRADIANPDKEILLAAAPVEKATVLPKVIAGIGAAFLLVITYLLLSGIPKGYQRLLSIIKLKLAAQNGVKVYSALSYWCDIWQIKLVILKEEDSPAKDWYMCFNTSIYGKRKGGDVPKIPAIAMDRWMVKKRYE